jgi:hypothetical protein
MWLVGWLITVIHTWISMRWAGFAIAVGAGIGVTFCALFAASASLGKILSVVVADEPLSRRPIHHRARVRNWRWSCSSAFGLRRVCQARRGLAGTELPALTLKQLKLFPDSTGATPSYWRQETVGTAPTQSCLPDDHLRTARLI